MLSAAVNRALAELYRSALIAGIYDRWFGAFGRPSPALQSIICRTPCQSEGKEATMMPTNLSCRWLGALALGVVFVGVTLVVGPPPAEAQTVREVFQKVAPSVVGSLCPFRGERAMRRRALSIRRFERATRALLPSIRASVAAQ
jgi:hypothetical protein